MAELENSSDSADRIAAHHDSLVDKQPHVSRASAVINRSIDSLLPHILHVTPLDPNSLQVLGDKIIGACIDLCLRRNDPLFLPAVDRADCIRSIVLGYVQRDNKNLAEALLARAESSDFLNGFGGDRLSYTQLDSARRIIEEGKSRHQEHRDTPSGLRDSFLRNTLCAAYLEQKDYSDPTGPLSLDNLAKAPLDKLFSKIKDDETRSSLISRLQALAKVDRGDYHSGFQQYLSTRSTESDQHHAMNELSYEQKLCYLLNYASATGASDEVVLAMIPSFKINSCAFMVQTQLSRKALAEARFERAITYAESIALQHWRPTVLGEIASVLFNAGKDSRGVLESALNQSRDVNSGHPFAICPMFASSAMFQLSGLINLGNTLSK